MPEYTNNFQQTFLVHCIYLKILYFQLSYSLRFTRTLQPRAFRRVSVYVIEKFADESSGEALRGRMGHERRKKVRERSFTANNR